MSAPNQWAWTFYASNGTTVLGTSALQNPSFTFPSSGPFFARLIATLTTLAPPNSGDSGLVAFTVDPIAGPPTIAITGPTGATTFSTNNPTLILSGVATDVTGVAWANTTTGAGAAATGLDSWITTPIPLQTGANTLVMTGFGQAPNATAQIVVTYTPLPPATPLPPDLMRGFGPVRGVAANDFIQIPLTTHSAQSTFREWVARWGAGARCLWTKSSNADQGLTESIIALGDGLLHFYRRYSLSTGHWTCPEPAAGVRYCLTFKIDTDTPTALPIAKIDNVIQSLTAVHQPGAGETPVNNATGYMLGNWPGQTGSWLGDQAKWTKNAYLTTAAEDTAFFEGSDPMTAPASATAPVAYHKLDGTAANEPDSVTTTVSALTGTVVENYAVTAPPTVALSVTAGSPAQGIPYQVTAATTGTVDRIGFFKDTVPPTGMVLVREDAVAPYTLFAAPAVLGPGAHTIEARAYETAGATVADTDTLNVTEPSATSGTFSPEYEFDRKALALTYDIDVNGTLNVTIAQPQTGNPKGVVIFPGPDVEVEIGVTPVYAGGPGVRTVFKPRRYTNPALTPPDGFKEVSRAYIPSTTSWVNSYRVNRKDLAVSYNLYRAGSLVLNVLQPASGPPTFVDAFADPNGEVVFNVAAVFAGTGEGPRMGTKLTYVAPEDDPVTGFQEHSRTYTP